MLTNHPDLVAAVAQAHHDELRRSQAVARLRRAARHESDHRRRRGRR